jgi:hypothetical protein
MEIRHLPFEAEAVLNKVKELSPYPKENTFHNYKVFISAVSGNNRCLL